MRVYRQKMPRVYELKDLISDRSEQNTYFQNFDNSLCQEPEKLKTWLSREKVFQRLDPTAWEFLKTEAKPYLKSKNKNGRGHQQLITILNQAFAYNYLIDEGGLQVTFISTEQGQTPDLKGKLHNSKVLCEVKTINISEVEANRRKTCGVGSTTDLLKDRFFSKLKNTLSEAKRQMLSYDASCGIRRFAFVVLNFDDYLGEYKQNYYQQIDNYLADHQFPGIEIIFYNQRTAFHFQVSMAHAVVVNEPTD